MTEIFRSHDGFRHDLPFRRTGHCSQVKGRASLCNAQRFFINEAGKFASTQDFAQEINEPQRGSVLYTYDMVLVLLMLAIKG
jgi:hypothetical protein